MGNLVGIPSSTCRKIIIYLSIWQINIHFENQQFLPYSLCRPHQCALSSLSLSSLPSSPPSSSDWSPSKSKVGLLTLSTSSRTGAMLCLLSSAESPIKGRAKVLVPPASVLELLLLPLLLPIPIPGSWPSGLLSLESCRSMATVPKTHTLLSLEPS